MSDRDDDALGEAIEAGIRIFLGAVPALDPRPVPGVRALLAPVHKRWARLGFAGPRLAEIVVTPACGLAGASPGWALSAMQRCRDLARALDETSYESQQLAESEESDR